MTLYRKTVWYINGLREYTKDGYEKAAKHFIQGDMDVDLKGKVYLVTGANSGLGMSATEGIAARGGTVHMVCRNVSKAQAVRDDIAGKTNNENIFVHALDTSKPRDVIQFASEFSAKNDRLDALLNNAGCMVNERRKTDDGLEVNFATNTLGTHLLTMGLLHLLQKTNSPPSRVVIMSSGGMLLQKLDAKDLNMDKLDPFDGSTAYAQQKRQQIVLAEQYTKRFSPDNKSAQVKFWSCHPGWADTPSVKDSLPDFYEKNKHKLRTVEQGADTMLWLAISKSASKQPGGLFFQDRAPASIHLPLACTRSDEGDEELLWNTLEKMREKFSPE